MVASSEARCPAAFAKPDLCRWRLLSVLATAVQLSCRSRWAMILTELRKRQRFRSERTASPVSCGQPLISTVCASCSSSASASADRSDSSHAPPSDSVTTEPSATAAGHRATGRQESHREPRPPASAGEFGASVDETLPELLPSKAHADSNAWSSCSVTSSSSQAGPRWHHRGNKPSVRPSLFRTVNDSSAVRPLSSSSSSESCSPPADPQHQSVSERSRTKLGSASASTIARWGRAEAFKRRRCKRWQPAPTLQRASFRAHSESGPAGTARASCRKPGQPSATASSASALTTLVMPSSINISIREA
mmetsp:Transcript_96339/g.249172  ORF Transcript_96339/g.249172 Transcript_96339/m.249172 type:complete len:307 (-) Transcript_96339:136-1056(-)